MDLPFTDTAFLDVFEQYNYTLGYAIPLLWLITAGLVAGCYFSRRLQYRWLIWLLIVHWLVSGMVYHIIYFSRINPAAYLFGAGFILQALLLYWFGLRKNRLHFNPVFNHWKITGIVLVVYSLAYPFIGIATGFEYPRMAVFAVPCPTTLLTAGLLLSMKPPVPAMILVIPVIWSMIGGSAAFLLGIYPDWMLPVAAILMLIYLFAPNSTTTPI